MNGNDYARVRDLLDTCFAAGLLTAAGGLPATPESRHALLDGQMVKLEAILNAAQAAQGVLRLQPEDRARLLWTMENAHDLTAGFDHDPASRILEVDCVRYLRGEIDQIPPRRDELDDSENYDLGQAAVAEANKRIR